MTPLVERNTTIPVEKKNVFSTAADNQTAVTVKVFQGERKFAADNRLLDEFNLEGIPGAPRGVPQIEVKFDIDQNGILSVSAKDLGTNVEASVQIKQSSALSEDEIDRMRSDADEHAESDKRQLETVQARNQAEHLCFTIEKTIKENEDKLSDADKEPLEQAIEKTREVAKGDDPQAIKAAADELEQASQAFSKVLYEKTAESGGDTAGDAEASEGSKDDDAIDAEFEVKKDE